MNTLIGKKTKPSRRKIKSYINWLKRSGSIMQFNSTSICCLKSILKDRFSFLKMRIKTKLMRINILAGWKNCPLRRKNYGF